jgi:transglutaminase/protease-like cytokinesis protein 3
MQNFIKSSRIIRYIIILLFSFSMVSANDFWRAEYKTADELAAKTKKTKDVGKLTKALTSELTKPIDKYRAIFTWIALNITYDCKSFKSQNYSNLEPADVLSKGKSICEGYSGLFEAMCKEAGLQCETISGWTKNNFAKIGNEFVKNPTHAWNAISIDNKWYLIDVTWAAGSTEGNCDKFIKEFSPVYFCTPPQIFGLNHFPQDNKWLLGYNPSKKEFQQAPHFYNKALEYNLTHVKPENGIIKYKKGLKIDFEFSLDQPIKNITVKPIEETYGKQMKFKQSGNTISFTYELTRKTSYLFVFFDLQGAMVYKVE